MSALSFLLIWAAPLAAQIHLEPVSQLQLTYPSKANFAPRTVDVQRTGSGFQVTWNGAQALFFDSEGQSMGSAKWMGLNPDKGNRPESRPILGPHLTFGRHTLRVAGNQLTLCAASGQPTFAAIFGESHSLPFAFRSHPQDSIWYMADVHSAYKAVAAYPYVVLPLACSLDDAYEDRRNVPYPQALLPYLQPENWLPHQPTLAVISLDTATMTHIPPARSKSLKSWKPDLRPPLALMAPRDPLLAAWQQDGRLSPWLNQPVVACAADAGVVWATCATSDRIEGYSVSGARRHSIAKHGFSREGLCTFPWTQVEQAIVRAGGIPASQAPMDGPGCQLPTKREQEVIDYLFELSAAAYGRSTTDEQLATDPKRDLLFRVVSKPKPEQDSTWWAEKLQSNYLPLEELNALRARTLQVYDLAAEGRFVGEIEVPPLFRILEIDPQGILWAVTGVDETAITVGRFRLVRE